MIKKIAYIILLIILTVTPVHASNINTINNLNEAMTYYYKNKDLTQALKIIQQLSDAKILDEYPQSFTTIVGFIIGISGENKNVNEKIKQLKLSSDMQKCVTTAENMLKQYSFETILTDPDKIGDERGLDLLWGVFFATGNSKIPETIHAFVEKNKISDAPIGKKTRQDIVVMSAIWSLESNAEQHDIVIPYAKFPIQSDNKGNQNIITFYHSTKK